MLSELFVAGKAMEIIMKYRVILNDDDYIKFNVYTVKNSNVFKKTFKLSMLIIAVVVLISVAMSFATNDTGSLATPILYTAIIIPIMLLSFLYLSKKNCDKTIERIVKLQLKDGKAPYSREAEIEFTPDQIIERTSIGETRLAYSVIDKIYDNVDAKAVYVYIGQQRAFIIPYSALGEDRETVIKMLNDKKLLSNS